MKKGMFVWMMAVVFVFSSLGLALAQQAVPQAAGQPAGPPPVVKDMVAKAKATIKTVTPADVKKAIDTKEKAVYLDVRDPGEFAAGHIPGAINVSRGTWSSISLARFRIKAPRSTSTARQWAARH